MAPDLSPEALQHYCNIDEYLQLSGFNVHETSQKKKKKNYPTDSAVLLQVSLDNSASLSANVAGTASPIITSATCRLPPSISTDNPSPIHSKALNSCANPTYPPSSPPSSSPLLATSDNYDIAAIGSITIVDDIIEPPELQLAPGESDEALQWDKDCQEYYNDIQENFHQANADATETKKKKKKKKDSNPTSTPDNPILFYV
jgi:hypothetical protein